MKKAKLNKRFDEAVAEIYDDRITATVILFEALRTWKPSKDGKVFTYETFSSSQEGRPMIMGFYVDPKNKSQHIPAILIDAPHGEACLNSYHDYVAPGNKAILCYRDLMKGQVSSSGPLTAETAQKLVGEFVATYMSDHPEASGFLARAKKTLAAVKSEPPFNS